MYPARQSRICRQELRFYVTFFLLHSPASIYSSVGSVADVRPGLLKILPGQSESDSPIPQHLLLGHIGELPSLGSRDTPKDKSSMLKLASNCTGFAYSVGPATKSRRA